MKPLEVQFAEALHQTAHAWRNELDRRLRPLGFSHSRWLLLLHLSRNDGCTHSELAQHMGIEAATLVRLVDCMEQDGLVTRSSSETDRRVKHLNLTRDGNLAVANIRSHAAALRKEILAETAKEEIGATLKVLTGIRENLAR